MAKICKELCSRVTAWVDRLYAVQIKEFVPRGFRSHVFGLRVTGLWPTIDDDSRRYTCFTAASYLLVGIIVPLMVSANIITADSIEGAMDHLFLSLTYHTSAVKAAIIYWHRDSIRDYFRMYANLLRGVDCATTERMNIRIHVWLTAVYILAWTAIAIQTVFTAPEEAIWRSTVHWPYEFARSRWLYLTVLVYQALSIFVNIFWVGVEDALYVALINAACSHVTELKERLRRLGTQQNDLLFYKDLIKCCERYEKCLRYVDHRLSGCHKINARISVFNCY